MIEKLALVGANEALSGLLPPFTTGKRCCSQSCRIKDGWAIVAKVRLFVSSSLAQVFITTLSTIPSSRPEGVVGIGEYGKGRGSRPIWVYYDETGKKVFTRGNPAALGMWYATEEMRRSILDVAREVFK